MKFIESVDQIQTAFPVVIQEIKSAADDFYKFIEAKKTTEDTEKHLGAMYGYLEIQRSTLELIQKDFSISNEQKLATLNGAISSIEITRKFMSDVPD